MGNNYIQCNMYVQAALGTMDGIIDTVSQPHPLKPLLDLLRTDGKLVMLGAPDLDKPAEIPLLPLLGKHATTTYIHTYISREREREVQPDLPS